MTYYWNVPILYEINFLLKFPRDVTVCRREVMIDKWTLTNSCCLLNLWKHIRNATNKLYEQFSIQACN